MTLLAIWKSRYRQREIRDELLNQIAIRIPTINHIYISSSHNDSPLLHSKHRLINRKEESSESEEVCFKTVSIDSIPNPNPILIEPFYHNLNIQQQQSITTTTRKEDKRRNIATVYQPATPLIKNSYNKGESGPKIPEQWQLTRMRIYDNKISRADVNMNRGTHPVVTNQ